jgi:signal transduction histidine kinase
MLLAQRMRTLEFASMGEEELTSLVPGRPVSLVRAIGEVARFHGAPGHHRNVRIVCEEPDHEIMVLGNVTMVSSILAEIVGNAVKYSLPRREVRIRCSDQGTQAIVDITNFGLPIADDELGRIFQAGYRGSAARTTSAAPGMGLHVAGRLAAALGGSVEVRSRAAERGAGDEGAALVTFRIRLPRAEREAP